MTRTATITIVAVRDELALISEDEMCPVAWNLTFEPPFATKQEEGQSVAAIVARGLDRYLREDLGKETPSEAEA